MSPSILLKVKPTSVLESKSLSTNSDTPNCRTVASANATPTLLRLSFFESLTDIMTGADMISECANNSSSTSWRFPGEAYTTLDASLHMLKQYTFFESSNLALFLPPSVVQISILSCFAVRPSRKNDFAAAWVKLTLGRRSRCLPQYFMTECVLKTWVATKIASAPCTV